MIKEVAVGIEAEAFVSGNPLYVLGAYNTGPNAAIVSGNDPFATGASQRGPRNIRLTSQERGTQYTLSSTFITSYHIRTAIHSAD